MASTSSTPRLLASAWPTSDPPRDHDQLGRVVRMLSWMTAGMSAASLLSAIAMGDPGLFAMGLVLAAFVGWIRWAWPRVPERGGGWLVMRVAVAIPVIVLLFLVLVPATGFGMTGLALIPVVVALPYLDSRGMWRLAVIAWVVSVGIVACAELSLRTSLPPGMGVLTRVLGIASGAATILVLLWQHHQRLRESASELGAVVAMSRDLAQLRDPARIGERMAMHMALAAGADACTIVRWDRDADSLAVFGVHPADRASSMVAAMPLLTAPIARRALVSGHAVIVDAEAPDADPVEVAWVQERGRRAVLLLPLSVQGETIGLLELATDHDGFGARTVERARMLATEAAMALENARLSEELRYQAFHDSLTRLANRALFTDRLDHALARRGRSPGVVAVLFIDVDDFKAINDRLGHVRGDQLLREAADRISRCLRSADTGARVGGDEFAVLLEDVADRTEADMVAHHIIEAMSAPIALGASRITTAVSIGICFSDDGGATADALLRNAEHATSRARSEGKARIQTYRPSMRAGADERLALEVALQGAAEREELRLQYQPVVDLRTGLVSGLEALVRWQSPAHGWRMPGDFITLAEDSGLIVPIGRWVLAEACRQTRIWQRVLGRDDLFVSVNISARQFQHQSLPTDVADALGASGLPPSALVIELTESVLMAHTPTTITTLQGLRALGVRVAIDDFGTGYSSLSYLQRFPVDVLKIDRSFVEAASLGPDGAALVRAIVEVGGALHLRVVAEGIEREEQIAMLTGFGCEHGQGYLFSPPLGSHEAGLLLVAQPPPWGTLAGIGQRLPVSRPAIGSAIGAALVPLVPPRASAPSPGA